MSNATMELRPQPGPQEAFFASKADIVVYGGAAFSGKSMAILMEAARHTDKPGFGCVIFRRTYPEIKMQGGLWDKAMELYPALGGVGRESDLSFTWPSGARIKFAHMQHEKDRFAWQGAQIPLGEIDELPHFTETQFWYLLSRNRLPRDIGIRPYWRATCNPDPDSWVRKLLDWWIGDDGLPIESRSGKLRYFIRNGDDIQWADKISDLARPEDARSFTFISARMSDNQIGIDMDPGYRATLMSLPLYERSLLMDGNWNVRRDSGMRFKRKWFQIVDTLPNMEQMKRYWDRAATEANAQNKDPDYTAGVKGGAGPGGLLYVTDVTEFRGTPAKVESTIAAVALADGSHHGLCEQWLEQDPAQAGKAEVHHLSISLAKFSPRFCSPTGDRYVRSGPASSAAEVGRIKLLRGPWNERFLRQLDAFVDERFVDTPTGYHDDITTAFVGWYERMMLCSSSGPRVY
jgi:predicted phage terminase large subunit-like protein